MQSFYLFNVSPKSIFAPTIFGLAILFSATINAQSFWDDPAPMIVNNRNITPHNNSLREIAGRPAIAFCEVNANFSIRYRRAADSKGSTWGTPITVDNANFAGYDVIDMEVINGNPAVASSALPLNDIRYTRALDANGDFWASTVVVASSVSANQIYYVDLEEVNGKPAIAYHDSDDGDLYYVRATDAAGSTWGTPVLVASGGAGTYLSLSIIDGNPAIAYYNATSGDLEYVRANDADGSSWGTPVTAWSSGNVGLFASLTTVNGNPAIAFGDITNNRMLYIRASNSTGSAWNLPSVVTTQYGERMDLLVVDGKPAIAYWRRNSVNDLRYVYSQDINGTAWGTPDIVDGSGNVGNLLSMAIIDGNPAIAYQDNTNSDLKYVRSSIASGVLPVELTFFRGERTGEGVKLTWQTASEAINEGFEIQRSVDGEAWEILDFVYGNGTTVAVQNYDYVDKNPLEGKTYYRLKQMDYDGQFEYSAIIGITFDALTNELLTIYPTIVRDRLNIKGGSGKILIYNNLGQNIISIATYENQTTLNLASLPGGQYYLRNITPNNSKNNVFTFVKIE